MARDVEIEARLKRWAEWRKVGDGSGYSSISPLHPNWTPPSPGMRPGVRAARPTDARQTDCAVRRLSARLQMTLELHYCRNLSLAEQAERLDCAESTVVQRIDSAHRLLLGILNRFVTPIDATN